LQSRGANPPAAHRDSRKLSAIEFVTTEDYTLRFYFTQEKVSKFWNCPCSSRPLLAPTSSFKIGGRNDGHAQTAAIPGNGSKLIEAEEANVDQKRGPYKKKISA
jgi:hypothetical protein